MINFLQQLKEKNDTLFYFGLVCLFLALLFLVLVRTTNTEVYGGFLFFSNSFPELPIYYVWAIRLSIILFVIFSFEGFAMGSRLSHTVGAANDNSNLFVVGWSKTFGDLRVAHFSRITR